MEVLIEGIHPTVIQIDEDDNVLDFRKHMLRICSKQNNCFNRRSRKGSSSQYVGVAFCKHNKKFRAVVRYKNKSIHVGYFDNEIEAAKARDIVALQEYGEFVLLNFP